MLRIDYSLIELSPEDKYLVSQEVKSRIKRGRVPDIPRELSGRVVVLNPDPVQTSHQIPDDLRPRLRRVMLSPHEGSRHLPAELLLKTILETDEPLYALILETQSEFRSLVPFFEAFPRVIKAHPGLMLMMSGTMENQLRIMRQFLSDGRGRIVFKVTGGHDPVEAGSEEALLKLISLQDDLVTYSSPFFSQIRLRLDRSSRINAFNVSSLRVLHPVFGHGDVVEMETGKSGKKERMYVVDIPAGLIRDFQFRTNRSPDFFGVVMQGREIPSALFSEEHLEYRWVNFQGIQAFLHKPPGQDLVRVPMEEVKALRVNCLTGSISFVMKERESRLTFSQIESIVLKRKPPPSRAAGKSAPAEEPAEVELGFEHLIVPGKSSGAEDPLHVHIRESFYGGRIRGEIEQRKKLEIYSRRLAVGVVGPVAGQTLKLLGRWGLKELLDPEKFFYLCDSAGDLRDPKAARARLEEHFQALVDLLADILTAKPEHRYRLADMSYNLPISTDWADNRLATFETITAQDLEACYHEMNVLGQFIHHEFQRNFDQSVDDGSFFSRVEDCRSAGLLAKWLSELKRGAYGALPKPWEFPDVVFFGTEEDRGQNDREFFYPAISCAELFGEGEAGSLYEGADFDFSVFMEEQLTLAEHKARQETGREPGPEQLREQIRKSGAALAKKKVDLKAASKAISERDSEVYRQLLYREEVAYRKRYEGFSQDMEKVSQEMQTLTAEYRELAARIAPMLKNSGLEPGELLKADPENPRKSEERLNRLAGQEEERLFKLFGERSLGFQGFVREWERQLLKFPQIFKSLLENHRVWQKGREAGRGFELASGWKKRLEGAVQALKGQSPADLGPRARLVETQLRNLESDLEQQQARLDAQNRKNIQVAASLLVLVRRSMDRLEISAPQPNPQGVEDILAELDKLSSRYADISRMASQMAPRVLKLLEAREQDRVKRERLLEQREKLSLENAALAVAAGAADPPAPALTGETVDDGQLRLAEKTFREMQERLRQAPQMLEECSKKSAESLRLARGEGASYSRLFARRREAARMTSRLYRLRLSRKSLEQRKTLMEKELAELPELVRQKFMPARNRLINEVFLPEAERRSRNLVKVDLLVNKVLGLSRESLWGMYLDRAVARRFHARHFLRGCLIGHDINSHEYPKLRNIEAGLKLFARTLRHNYNLNQLEGMQVSDFQFLPPEKGPAIIKRLESIASQSRLGLTFMVLPVTMPFREALDIIKRKEVIFQGVPRLVLVYISKFDGSLLLRDPLARHSYFSALKHNVVLNVDGRLLVDNPRAIAGRLLSDTFGCAYDIRQIEELSDDESALGAAG